MKRITYINECGQFYAGFKLEFIKAVITRNTITLTFGRHDYHITKKWKNYTNVLDNFIDIDFPEKDMLMGMMICDGDIVYLGYDNVQFGPLYYEEDFLIDFKHRLNYLLGFDFEDHCHEVFRKLEEDVEPHKAINETMYY